MDPRLRVAAAGAADLAAVALFVAIGRASHREDQSPFIVTYWPFAAGLAAGWAVSRGWRAPLGFVPTGVAAWGGTVAGGMLLRAASGQGVQPSFVVVTTIVTGGFLIGWRGLVAATERASTRTEPGPLSSIGRRRPRPRPRRR